MTAVGGSVMNSGYMFQVPSVLQLKLYFTILAPLSKISLLPFTALTAANGGWQLSQDLVAASCFCRWKYFPSGTFSLAVTLLCHLYEHCKVSPDKLDKSI